MSSHRTLNQKALPACWLLSGKNLHKSFELRGPRREAVPARSSAHHGAHLPLRCSACRPHAGSIDAREPAAALAGRVAGRSTASLRSAGAPAPPKCTHSHARPDQCALAARVELPSQRGVDCDLIARFGHGSIILQVLGARAPSRPAALACSDHTPPWPLDSALAPC